MEHEQHRRLGKRLVLARDLTLELLDALGLGRPAPSTWLRERFLDRDAPRIELLAVNARGISLRDRDEVVFSLEELELFSPTRGKCQ